MPTPLIYRNRPPALLPLFSKALIPKRMAPDAQPTIPELEVCLLGVSTVNERLADYSSVCGFSQHSSVPVTWPHILAFPLHLKLLTEPDFPLPLLGLVHLRNTITQHRPIGAGETLDLTVRLGNQQETARGIEFDLITEARSAGTLAWQEISTNLFRKPQPKDTTPGHKQASELQHFPQTLSIRAPESIGRQYGAVSGDRNPIHLHALTARAFGFPRAIAHGMWSQAKILAELEQQEDWKGDAFTVSCQFKKPFFLPGEAILEWQADQSGWDYQLLNSRGEAPHLTGRVDWL